MAEDEASDTADKNIRILAAGFSLAFAFGGEEEFRKENWAWCTICVVLAIMFQFLFWLWKRIVPILGVRLVGTARALATDAKWWVGLALCFLLLVSSSLLNNGLVFRSKSTEDVTAPTASLRLQFNSADAEPVDISSSNVADWTWIAPTESRKVDCPLQLFPLLQNQTTIGQEANDRPCYEQVRTWVFVLIFKNPVDFTKINLDPHGATLPKWEMSESSARFAMLWFHGSLPPMILDFSTSK